MNDLEPTEPSPDEKLEAAITEYLHTTQGSSGLLVDWFLITAEHVDTGDGRSMTSHGVFGPDHQRTYQALGLLHYATLRAEHRFTSNRDD